MSKPGFIYAALVGRLGCSLRVCLASFQLGSGLLLTLFAFACGPKVVLHLTLWPVRLSLACFGISCLVTSGALIVGRLA